MRLELKAERRMVPRMKYITKRFTVVWRSCTTAALQDQAAHGTPSAPPRGGLQIRPHDSPMS